MPAKSLFKNLLVFRFYFIDDLDVYIDFNTLSYVRRRDYIQTAFHINDINSNSNYVTDVTCPKGLLEIHLVSI